MSSVWSSTDGCRPESGLPIVFIRCYVKTHTKKFALIPNGTILLEGLVLPVVYVQIASISYTV